MHEQILGMLNAVAHNLGLLTEDDQGINSPGPASRIKLRTLPLDDRSYVAYCLIRGSKVILNQYWALPGEPQGALTLDLCDSELVDKFKVRLKLLKIKTEISIKGILSQRRSASIYTYIDEFIDEFTDE